MPVCYRPDSVTGTGELVLLFCRCSIGSSDLFWLLKSNFLLSLPEKNRSLPLGCLWVSPPQVLRTDLPGDNGQTPNRFLYPAHLLHTSRSPLLPRCPQIVEQSSDAEFTFSHALAHTYEDCLVQNNTDCLIYIITVSFTYSNNCFRLQRVRPQHVLQLIL